MFRPATLFWIALAAVAFLAFVPRAEPGGRPGQQAAANRADGKPGESFNWYGGETVLARQADGHFYADASVDGTVIRFLVDTGATTVALTGQDAIDLGLSWNEDQVGPIGQGANGTIYGVATELDHLELGGYRKEKVRAVIIPQGLQISLLGQSFLSGIDNVEIAGDRMILGTGG